jgi:hypothetical protein
LSPDANRFSSVDADLDFIFAFRDPKTTDRLNSFNHCFLFALVFSTLVVGWSYISAMVRLIPAADWVDLFSPSFRL